MDLVQSLQEIGLQEREIKIYLALLELGESTVLPLSKQSGIKRTYCYDILPLLQEKGLVSFIERNGRRHYSAEDPAKIEQLLKGRLERFIGILPDLRSIYGQSPNKPRVRYYEGDDVGKEIVDELARSKSFDAISSPDHLNKYIGKSLLEELAVQMVKRGTVSRELYTRGALPVTWPKLYKKPLQEVRYLPEGVTMQNDILIYGKKLVLISYEQQVHGLVIEGSAIVDAHKQLFELLWKSTPTLG
ncbi:MAG TPA: helix-turn-helix domain-containing protein [Patescibacteria group bacterium]